MPFHMHFSFKEYCKLRIQNWDSNTDLVSCWHKFSFSTGIFFSCNICVRKSYIWLSLWWVLRQTSWSRYLQINEDNRQVDLQSQLVYQQKFYVRNICIYLYLIGTPTSSKGGVSKNSGGMKTYHSELCNAHTI